MADWLDAINTLAPQAMPAVLVTVATVDGSAPRDAGAKMLVTQHAQFDTIGGGHLEMRACEIAREMLQLPASLSSRFNRFALGPSLGQCCGGVVQLAFERLDQSSSDFYKRMHDYWRNRQDCWRLVALDTQSSPALFNRDGPCLACDAQNAPTDFDRERPCHLMKGCARRSLAGRSLFRRIVRISFYSAPVMWVRLS